MSATGANALSTRGLAERTCYIACTFWEQRHRVWGARAYQLWLLLLRLLTSVRFVGLEAPSHHDHADQIELGVSCDSLGDEVTEKRLHAGSM